MKPMFSILFSDRRYKLGVLTPILSALILIWDADSSPETYKIFIPIWPKFSAICSSKVDLPIPGSPPTRTSEPLTSPPPKTTFNSAMPVLKRFSFVISISFNDSGFGTLPFSTILEPVVFCSSSSAKVFH